METLTAKSLIGKGLGNFRVEEYTEVYMTDVEGRTKTKTIGYFKSEVIAGAFVGNQIDSTFHRMEKVLLLTDGEVAFIVGNEAKLADEEAALLEVLQSARAKLSPAERELLGL